MKDEKEDKNEGRRMNETDRSLGTRTKQFALRIIRLYGSLPKSAEAQVIGKQILRSGTSVGAHYRESVRARSNAEFISKIESGLQELEETLCWLELLAEGTIIPISRLADLMEEANQITAILVTCVKNAKKKISEETRKNRASLV